MLKVEVFTSPSCPYCPMAEKAAEEAKGKLGDEMELEIINIMTDRQRAIDYGIMAVPAIAINGVVEFVGAPSFEELMAKLK
ncbi:MAG: MJ0307 family thioredoxin [Methanobrevibacter sp.]|nr:MJ0307 family thioredoxin [Methanobrevibacter sp.]